MVKVVIIGAGFGGLNVAKKLKNAPVEIILLDRMNHHVFQPLLYQVATATLSIGNIAYPIREIFRNQSNVQVFMENVERIDKEKKIIYTSSQDSFSYDVLVVAPGTTHSYFGHDEWEDNAPGLKTLADAVRIREKILFAFEKAERCENSERAQNLLRFVIVGAGPTGVELAGSIAEFAHHTLFNNFRHINPSHSKIILIEGASQVLPSYPPTLAKKALQDLLKIGVEVRLNTFVTGVTSEGIYIDRDFLAAPNVIWAAGNQAPPLLQTLNAKLDKQGRVKVDPDLTLPGYPSIFVIGDAAHCVDYDGKVLPGIAPVAIQQGQYVAKMIKKDQPRESRKPFSYFDKGTIATIGRGKAVAMIRKLQFTGFFAWLIWIFIHILYLVSFSNRILTFTQWLFLYLLGKRQSRVILHPIDHA